MVAMQFQCPRCGAEEVDAPAVDGNEFEWRGVCECGAVVVARVESEWRFPVKAAKKGDKK